MLNEVQEWMLSMRKALRFDKPKEIHISKEFHGKMLAHLAQTHANLGPDVSGPFDPSGEITFRSIPVVVD